MTVSRFTSFLISIATMFAVNGALAANVTADYKRPLSFEPNRGQADGQVEFVAHGAGYSLFLSRGEAVMAFKDAAPVRMRAVGANGSAPVEPLGAQASKSNYFIGNRPEKWHTNVANYAKVRYRDVYPGVDLIYYGNQRQVEYDFVVRPGAGAADILLDFEGAAKPTLERSGDLVMQTAGGELRWHKPVAYQEVSGKRQLVACDYTRKGEKLAFKLGAYDRTKPLVIDPVLVYSTYFGGSGNIALGYRVGDGANGVAVDPSGNAYVTGFAESADFPTKNPYQKGNNGFLINSNAFISKFDPKGNLIYSTYLGGSGFAGPDQSFVPDVGNAIAVDAKGNAYVTGSTGSQDFPLQNPFQNSNNASNENCIPCSTAFVTKLAPAGNALVFSTYLGGSGDGTGEGDGGLAISVDPSEKVYVTGFTGSRDFPLHNPFQSTWGNIFVTKFESTGQALVYSTYLGAAFEIVDGIAADKDGNAYVARGILVEKFDPAGTALLYSISYPAAISAIAVDVHGSVYITGTTTGGIPIKNAFQKELKNKKGNAFVAKFDPAGTTLVYSTYLGGSGNPNFGIGDGGTSIAVDSDGNAYVTGGTVSTDFPTKNAFQNTLKGSQNAFVTKIDSTDCALVYSSYLGGSTAAYSSSVAVDSHGNAYVTGTTGATDFPIKNAFQHENRCKGCTNAFVTKVSAK